MPKWKAQDRTVCIRGTVVCGQAEDDAECGIIVDAHNADIDALTAERDELKRRLDAVVAKISEAVVSDDDCVCSMLCHSAITAIAEGRDNG